jgi:hypothetical protein
MTHKPTVRRGGFGREEFSRLIDRDPYIASAASSSSSKTPPPPPARLRRLAAALHSLGPDHRPPLRIVGGRR